MTTLAVKNAPLSGKVVHVAYGCGCVRTFHVDQGERPRNHCPVHGDLQCSFTEEIILPKQDRAA